MSATQQQKRTQKRTPRVLSTSLLALFGCHPQNGCIYSPARVALSSGVINPRVQELHVNVSRAGTCKAAHSQNNTQIYDMLIRCPKLQNKNGKPWSCIIKHYVLFSSGHKQIRGCLCSSICKMRKKKTNCLSKK